MFEDVEFSSQDTDEDNNAQHVRKNTETVLGTSFVDRVRKCTTVQANRPKETRADISDWVFPTTRKIGEDYGQSDNNQPEFWDDNVCYGIGSDVRVRRNRYGKHIYLWMRKNILNT